MNRKKTENSRIARFCLFCGFAWMKEKARATKWSGGSVRSLLSDKEDAWMNLTSPSSSSLSPRPPSPPTTTPSPHQHGRGGQSGPLLSDKKDAWVNLWNDFKLHLFGLSRMNLCGTVIDSIFECLICEPFQDISSVKKCENQDFHQLSLEKQHIPELTPARPP